MTSQEKPWGILQPIIPEFYVKSLTKKSLFVGRQQTDYSLCTQAIGSTNLLASFSKLHFIIHRLLINTNYVCEFFFKFSGFTI